MRSSFLLATVFTAAAALGSVERRQDAGDIIRSAVEGLTSVVGNTIASDASSLISKAGAVPTRAASEITSDLSSLLSVAGSLTSDIPTGFYSSVTAAVGSAASRITAAPESVLSDIESKYSSISGFSGIRSDLSKAIASGTSKVDHFFSTQTAVSGSAASSLRSDLASDLAATATTSGSAASSRPGGSAGAEGPRVMGGVLAIVGMVAGIVAL